MFPDDFDLAWRDWSEPATLRVLGVTYDPATGQREATDAVQAITVVILQQQQAPTPTAGGVHLTGQLVCVVQTSQLPVSRAQPWQLEVRGVRYDVIADATASPVGFTQLTCRQTQRASHEV